MVRIKNGFLNTLFGVAATIVAAVFQFILIFVIIQEYGSQITGLMRSILSVISYLTLAEGALGTLTVLYLFKPLADDDFQTCNDIVNTTKREYRVFGGLYFLILIAIAFAYGAINNEINPVKWISKKPDHYDLLSIWQLGLIILGLGFNNIIFFVVAGAHFNLLQADQNNFLNRLIGLLADLAMNIIVIALILIRVPVYIPFLFYGLSAIIKIFATLILVKIKYPWLKSKGWVRQLKLIKQSNSIIVEKIAGVLLVNLDFILITIFLGYSTTTVYTLYMTVALLGRSVMLILINSFKENYGMIAANFGRIKWPNYSRFQLYAIILAGFLFVTQFILSPYLVNVLYANQILNSLKVNPDLHQLVETLFYRPEFSLLIALASTFVILSEPLGVLIYANVKYKQIQKYAYIQMGLQLLLSIVGGLIIFVGVGNEILGIYWLLISTIITSCYRFIALWIYGWHRLTYNSNYKFLWRHLMVLLIPIAVGLLVNYLYIFPHFPIKTFALSSSHVALMFVGVITAALGFMIVLTLLVVGKELTGLIRTIPFVYSLINFWVRIKYHENWVYFDSAEGFLLDVNRWGQKTKTNLKKLANKTSNQLEVYILTGKDWKLNYNYQGDSNHAH